MAETILALAAAAKSTRNVTENNVTVSSSEKKSALNSKREVLSALRQENKLLKASLKQKNRELALFVQVSKALSGALSFKKVLQLVLSSARRLVPCGHWSILLCDEADTLLQYRLARGESIKALRPLRYKLGEGPAGQVALKGLTTAFQGDEPADRQIISVLPKSLNAETVLCLPILSKNQVVGVIQLVNRIGQSIFLPDDQVVLEKLLDLASASIERSEVFEHMSELVTTDDLTKLYNLRYLDRVLDVEIKRSKRYKSTLSLIFADLDYFKQVNDRWGHLAGSQVLVEVADILRESLRAVDVIARYGGDEFVVLLPNTTLARAKWVAERTRMAIRNFGFLKSEGTPLQITASFGIAGFPEHAKNKTDLIFKADKAMYHSKLTGRDKVSISGE